jgi:DNA replication protein DnaC
MGSGEQIKQRLDELTLSSSQEKNSEAFEEVTLSEEETAEALRAGREKKYFQLKREEYNAKIRAARVPTKFTSHQIFQAYTDHWDVDIENLEIVKNLCHYFTEDPRFDGDMKKGLFLVGGVGIGKSTLMQFFSRNQKASYRLISCRDVETIFLLL